MTELPIGEIGLLILILWEFERLVRPPPEVMLNCEDICDRRISGRVGFPLIDSKGDGWVGMLRERLLALVPNALFALRGGGVLDTVDAEGGVDESDEEGVVADNCLRGCKEGAGS